MDKNRTMVSKKVASESVQKEQLKKQLIDLDMYEAGMSEDEMKTLLGVVKVSKDTSFESPASQSDFQKSTSSTSMNLIEHHSELELTSLKETSPLFRKSESPDISIKRNSISNKSLHDNEKSIGPSTASTLFDQMVNQQEKEDYSYGNPHFSVSPSPSREHKIIKSTNISMSRQTKMNNRINLYSIDPLDCKQLGDELPLKRRNQHPRQKNPYLNSDGTLDVPEEILFEINTSLTQQAEQWHVRKPSVSGEFGWGPPIKIGDGKGSQEPEQDYLHATDDDIYTTPSAASATATRRTDTGSYELRSAPKKKDINDPYAFDDDNDDGIFEQQKKKKSKADIVRQTPKNSLKKPIDKGDIEVISDDEVIENSPPLQTSKSRKRAPTPDYPEDIPNNTKKFATATRTKLSGPRNKQLKTNNLVTKCNTRVTAKETPKKSGNLNPEEIAAEFTTVINDDDDDDFMEPKNFRTGKRIQRGISILTDARQAEEAQEKLRRKESQLLNQRKQEERQEKLRALTRESHKQLELKDAKEKKQKEQEDLYRNILSTPKSSTIRKRPELESDDSDRGTVEMDTSEDPSTTLQEANHSSDVVCPICNKKFPPKRIQDHASNCTDFNSGTEMDPSIECNICGNLWKNQKIYDKHRKKCIASISEEN